MTTLKAETKKLAQNRPTSTQVDIEKFLDLKSRFFNVTGLQKLRNWVLFPSFLLFYNISVSVLLIMGILYSNNDVPPFFAIISYLVEILAIGFSLRRRAQIKSQLDESSQPFNSNRSEDKITQNHLAKEDIKVIDVPLDKWKYLQIAQGCNYAVLIFKLLFIVVCNIGIVWSFVDIKNADLYGSYFPVYFRGLWSIGLLALWFEFGLFILYYIDKPVYQQVIFILNKVLLYGSFLTFFILFLVSVDNYYPGLTIFFMMTIIGEFLLLLGLNNKQIGNLHISKPRPQFFSKSKRLAGKRKNLAKFAPVNPEVDPSILIDRPQSEVYESSIDVLQKLPRFIRPKRHFKRKLIRIFAILTGITINFILLMLFGLSLDDSDYAHITFLIALAIVGEITFLVSRRSFKMQFKTWIANQYVHNAIRQSLSAEKLEQGFDFKSARRKWRRAHKKLIQSGKINPDVLQRSNVTKLSWILKKKYGLNILAQAIYTSDIAWEFYKKKQYSRAIGKYKKAILLVESAITYIENQVRQSSEFSFTLDVSLIYDILKLFQMTIQQIELEQKYKKASNLHQTKLDLQEIFDKIDIALKDNNDAVGTYNQLILLRGKNISGTTILEKIEHDFTHSLQIVENLQDRLTSLIEFLQSPENDSLLANLDNSQINSSFLSQPAYMLDTSDPNLRKIKVKTPSDSTNNLNSSEEDPQKTISIIREYEYIGGKIRLKTGLVNTTGKVVTNLALRYDLPGSLKWIIHEPNYTRRGDTILIPKLGGSEKIAISLYLEPMNCLQSPINATLTYFDAQDHPKAVIMPPKMVSITCPIFFTRDEANVARVRSIQGQLKYHDKKIFPIGKSNNLELIFNQILETVGTHDVKLVEKEFSQDKNYGQSLYYGITKVKKQKMVIQIVMDGNHQILEIQVTGDDPGPITGLLAELEGQIREKLLMSKVITDGNVFHDIATSVMLGHCPYCNGPIESEWIALFKKGQQIQCKYCDTPIVPY